MEITVIQTVDRMRVANRQELLTLLATAITEMTISARAHYDGDDSVLMNPLIF